MTISHMSSAAGVRLIVPNNPAAARVLGTALPRDCHVAGGPDADRALGEGQAARERVRCPALGEVARRGLVLQVKLE